MVLGAGAAVDLENFAGDVGCEIAREEEETVRDVAWGADATEWDGFDERGDHFFWEIFDHVGFGDARGDAVDADAVRSEFAGEGFDDAVDGEFASRIHDTGRLAVNADHRTCV